MDRMRGHHRDHEHLSGVTSSRIEIAAANGTGGIHTTTATAKLQHNGKEVMCAHTQRAAGLRVHAGIRHGPLYSAHRYHG